MNILWFTNNAVNLDKSLLGGWMQSLENGLSHDKTIKLSIATRYNGKTIRRISESKTTYFLLPDKRTKLQKRIDLFLNREPIGTYLKEYLKLIEEVQPDIIHVFGTEMDYGLITEKTFIPVVIHIQGILHPCYYQLRKIPVSLRDKIFSPSFRERVRGNTITNSLRIFKRRVGVEEKILSACRYIIGRTAWDKHVTRLLSPASKYFHCDEMLRQVFFDAAWHGHKNETLHIVSTISNPFYKGHDTIVSTCQVLKKAGENFIWHVIGVGPKSSSFRVFYKAHLQVLSGRLQLHGMLSPKAIIDLLQQASVYVHPSHIENSSNAICEAMAVGMPVIALQVGGNSSIVTHGEDGWLVSDNDPYILAATIIQVARDKETAMKTAARAKDSARSRHAQVRIVHQLKNIYATICADHVDR